VRPSSGVVARVASLAALAAALACALAVSALALARRFETPFVDDWRLLDEMNRMPFLSWLFSSQNGHRVPVTLLLLYLDQTFAHGRMLTLMLAMLAEAWITAALAAIRLERSRDVSPALRRILIAFTTSVLFLAGSASDFHWGTNQGSVWTMMWLFVALFAFDSARARGGGRADLRFVGVAAASALLAAFGHAMGFAAWASLLVMWALARMPASAAVLLGASALAGLALHRLGPSVAGALTPGTQLAVLAAHPGEAILFVCAFVGSPLGWILRGMELVELSANLEAARTAGAVALAGLLVILGLAWRRRGSSLSGIALVGVGLMVFTLAGAVLVASARLGSLGPRDAVSPRFLGWAFLFWIGGAWALGGLAERRAARAALASLMCALPIAMLPALADAHARHQKHLENAARTSLLLLLGHHPGGLVDFPGWLSYERLELIARVAKRLAETRRSPFDDPRYGLGGSSFAERFAPSDGPPCGRLLRVEWFSPDGKLAAVAGDLAAQTSRVTTIVAVDPRGNVCGLGEERPPLPRAPRDRRWLAMLGGIVPGERHMLWAILPDGRTACSLGSIGWSPRARAPEP
jgi:hypothetical protein